jgi:hypothetical protein
MTIHGKTEQERTETQRRMNWFLVIRSGSVSVVPMGLCKIRACPCPGTEVPGYYQAAPAGARTAFAPCHAKVSRTFSSWTLQLSDRCR